MPYNNKIITGYSKWEFCIPLIPNNQYYVLSIVYNFNGSGWGTYDWVKVAKSQKVLEGFPLPKTGVENYPELFSWKMLQTHRNTDKVRIFWEGHKILQNLPRTFVHSTYRQK